MNGFLSIIKPPGMTSNDVVLAIRKQLPRGTRVGHAGTLDPEAAGVLPIMIGKATRLFDFLADKTKEYIAEWIPGIATDTLDIYGKIVGQEEVSISDSVLIETLSAFEGDIMQIPPMVSALKRDGIRLYDLARSGQVLDLPAREIHVDKIRILRREPNGSAWLQITCGKGTYIRSLCRDIGNALQCKACMGTLIRTRVGGFTIDESSALEEIQDAAVIERHLIQMDQPLSHFPRLDFSEAQEKRVRNGNPIPVTLPESFCSKPLRLYLKNEFCGVGIFDGQQIRFLAMLSN